MARVAKREEEEEEREEERNDNGGGWGGNQNDQQENSEGGLETFDFAPSPGPPQPPQFQMPRESSQAGPSTNRHPASQRAATFRIPTQPPAPQEVPGPSFAAPMVTSTPRKVIITNGSNTSEPLFLPDSQLSPDARRELRESGWDLENMNEEEIDKMFGNGADDWELDLEEEDSGKAGSLAAVEGEQSLQFGPTPQEANGKKVGSIFSVETKCAEYLCSRSKRSFLIALLTTTISFWTMRQNSRPPRWLRR